MAKLPGHPLRRARLLAAFLSLIASCGFLFSEEPADPAAHYLGINVWFIGDYQGDNAFVDIMKHARSWQKYNWNDGAAVVDADGWPMEDCSTVIFGEDNETGTYHLVFTGQASSISMMWLSGSVSDVVYDSGTNTTTADVELTDTSGGSGGLKFYETKRQPGDSPGTGITNVRLYRPGYPADGSVVFTTRFLNVMNKFQVVRFMDWVHTNKNALVSWDQRRNPGQAARQEFTNSYSHTGSRGHVMEHFIQLCNEINADLWINIPVDADDDYVTKTAQLIKYGSDGVNPYTSHEASPVYPPLNSNLKVYVEYGNEIWNSAPGFQCFGWVENHALAIQGPPYDHPIEFDGEEDQYTLMARYAAWKTVEISNLFRSVFSDGDMGSLVRLELMGQIGGNWFNPRQLPWLEAFYSTYRDETDPFPNTDPQPVSYYMHGAGGSGYYGVNDWSSPNPDDFFAAGNYPATDWWKSTGIDALRARNYGLYRVGYESGMGLDGGGDTFTDAEKQTLNEDIRMKDLTEVYHDEWTRAGGELMVYYVNVGPVNWEFTWDVDETSSPKLQAIDEIRDNRARVAVDIGQEVSGTAVAIDQRDTNVFYSYAPSSTYDTTVDGEDCIVYKQSDEWACFAINTTQGGYYDLSVRLRSGAINLVITVNGAEIGTIPVADTGGVLVDTSTIQVPVLANKLNALRIMCSGGGMTLRSATLTYASSFDLQITTTTLPDADQYQSYSTTLEASAGIPPYTWSIASGSLPSGLSLDPATGEISGTPDESGSFPFTARVDDSDSPAAYDTQELTLTVNPAPPLEITTTSLPNGTLSQAYSETLSAGGGKPPYTWSIESGSLPDGLSLNTSTGEISGTPTATGDFPFTARVDDSDSPAAYDTQALSISILQSPPAAPDNLTASAVGSTQIELGWNDNSTDETLFKIERSPDGSTGWTQIATVETDAHSYLDTGLTTGNTYYYRVRAYNGADSDYSNTASATVTASGSATLFSEDFCAALGAEWTQTVTGGANNPTLTVDSCAMTIGNLDSMNNDSGAKAYIEQSYDNSVNQFGTLTGYFDIDFSNSVFVLPGPDGQGTVRLFEHWLSSGNNATMRMWMVYSGWNDCYKLEASNGIQWSGGAVAGVSISKADFETNHPRMRIEYVTTYTDNGSLNWDVDTDWTIINLADMGTLYTFSTTHNYTCSDGGWNPFTDANHRFLYGCVNHNVDTAQDMTGSHVWEYIHSGAQTPGGGPGEFRFGQESYTVNESDTVVQASIPVWRVNGTDGAVSVDFATPDGTAIAGTDYTANSGTLNWADGEDSVKTFTVDILSDPAAEPEATLSLTLSAPSGGASLGTPDTATLAILDWEQTAAPPVYIIAVTPGGTDLTLEFGTVSGKLYRLMKNTSTPDLADGGWTATGDEVTGDGTVMTFTVAKPAAGQVFYTIEYEE